MTRAAVLSSRYLDHIRIFVIAFAISLVLVAMPMPAEAQGLTEEQQRSLRDLLVSFNVDSNTVEVVEAILQGGDIDPRSRPRPTSYGGIRDDVKVFENREEKRLENIPPHAAEKLACVEFARNLMRGAVGQDVSRLQEFLRETGDFEGATTTSYFGPLTEQALQKWQQRMGIATSGNPFNTGFGALGPMTRGRIISECMGGGGGLHLFSASPRSGVAPLLVEFVIRAGNTYRAVKYKIDFGDGTSAQVVCSATTTSCGTEQKLTHVYQNTGTYTAKLTRTLERPCPASATSTCPASALVSQQMLKSLTISVSAATSTQSSTSSGVFSRLSRTVENISLGAAVALETYVGLFTWR